MGDRMRWEAFDTDRQMELEFESWPEGYVNVYLRDDEESITLLMSADKNLLIHLGEYITDTLEVMDDWEKRKVKR